MNFTFLKWDSDFFERKVFKLEIDNTITKEVLLNTISDCAGDLYYIFSNTINPQVSEIGGELVDTKIVFLKDLSLSEPTIHDVDIVPYKKETAESLLELAFLSGEYSRFKTDQKIAYKYRELYALWLNRSLNKEIADEVFLHKSGDDINGFITLKQINDTAIIGLIAVDEKVQGKNIGKKLISKVEDWCRKKSVYKLLVATQKANLNACLFYQKCGFDVDTESHIYHYYKRV